MALFESITDKVASFLLKRQLKKLERRCVATNLASAKTIGIIFDATLKENFNYLKPFVNYLTDQNKKVEVLGYINEKVISDFYTARKGFSFFCKKDLNWYGKPTEVAANDFAEKQFDILIDLSIKRTSPIHYISATSKSTFKIGRFSDDEDSFDFMIDISGKSEISFLIEQIKHYLSIINVN